jgi:hypothetical protein
MPSGTYKLQAGPFFYIGSTTNIRRRFQDHKWRLNKGIHPNPKIQAAHAEHGAATLTLVNVIRNNPRETIEQHRARLRKAEQALLDEHAADPHLCNRSLNASGPDLWTEVANRLKERWKDPEYRQRMTNATRNRETTAATRLKLSAAKTGAGNPKSRPVVVTAPDGTETTHPCTRDAARFFGVSQQLMDLWLKGKTAWPGTGKRTKPENSWIAPYRATFASPSARRTR